MLEDEADAALLHGLRVTSLPAITTPAGVELLEPGDRPQQGRLAAPARAQQRRQRAVADVDRDVVQGREVSPTLGRVLDDDAHVGFLLGSKPVHEQQRRDREDREHDRGRVGPGDVELLELLLHVERQRLGLPGDLPRDHADGPELAQRARRRQHDAVGDAPADRRQGDAPEGLPPVGAQRRGGLLLLVADLLQHRLDLADHERQRDEDRREHHAGHREDDLDPLVDEPLAEPAVAAVDEDQRRGRSRPARSRTGCRSRC